MKQNKTIDNLIIVAVLAFMVISPVYLAYFWRLLQ
jgi:hypothetical protein